MKRASEPIGFANDTMHAHRYREHRVIDLAIVVQQTPATPGWGKEEKQT